MRPRNKCPTIATLGIRWQTRHFSKKGGEEEMNIEQEKHNYSHRKEPKFQIFKNPLTFIHLSSRTLTETKNNNRQY